MNNIDMHFHSLKSDGSSCEDTILQTAQEKGLQFITLTDHDTVSRGFKDRAEKYGITSCESTEISAVNPHTGKYTHLTFYAESISQEVSDILDHTVASKIQLIAKQVKHLNKEGFYIVLEELYRFIELKGRKIESINKYDLSCFLFTDPHNISMIDSLVDGKAITPVEFFIEYLKKGGENYDQYSVEIPEYEPSLEVCKQIRQSNNAILSIAHPNFSFKESISVFEQALPEYIKRGGINALEINTRATKQRVNAIINLAEQHDLFLTFGSDCHHIGQPDNKHGDLGQLNPNISADFVEKSFSAYREILGV